MTGLPRVRLRVAGRVQGVGFRWFVRETARRESLSGWVRNEPDGSVLLEVQGAADSIARLRTAVEEGPPGARVDGLEELTPGTEPLPHPFSVAR